MWWLSQPEEEPFWSLWVIVEEGCSCIPFEERAFWRCNECIGEDREQGSRGDRGFMVRVYLLGRGVLTCWEDEVIVESRGERGGTAWSIVRFLQLVGCVVVMEGDVGVYSSGEEGDQEHEHGLQPGPFWGSACGVL